RLAFEIDDDEVVASLQNLPEVVVAMNADAKTAHPAIENPPRAFLQLLFPLQQLVGGRISLSASAQELHGLHDLRADVLINRALIVRRDRLRSECRNVAARRQSKMQLRRPLPQH